VYPRALRRRRRFSDNRSRIAFGLESVADEDFEGLVRKSKGFAAVWEPERKSEEAEGFRPEPLPEEFGLLSVKLGPTRPFRRSARLEYLATIQQAIAQRRVVEIEYTNLQKEISKRKAEPIGLVFYAFNWHLIGWCHLKKDYRDFRVSRILRLQCTPEDFTQKKHIEMNEYMKQIPVNY